jgi:hypothetical protein
MRGYALLGTMGRAADSHGANAENGVAVAGSSTIVQPVASLVWSSSGSSASSGRSRSVWEDHRNRRNPVPERTPGPLNLAISDVLRTELLPPAAAARDRLPLVA